MEPLKVGWKVEIEEKIINVELNTGSLVSIISEYEYRKKFWDIRLETDGLKLQFHTNVNTNIKTYSNKH